MPLSAGAFQLETLIILPTDPEAPEYSSRAGVRAKFCAAHRPNVRRFDSSFVESAIERRELTLAERG